MQGRPVVESGTGAFSENPTLQAHRRSHSRSCRVAGKFESSAVHIFRTHRLYSGRKGSLLTFYSICRRQSYCECIPMGFTRHHHDGFEWSGLFWSLRVTNRRYHASFLIASYRQSLLLQGFFTPSSRRLHVYLALSIENPTSVQCQHGNSTVLFSN